MFNPCSVNSHFRASVLLRKMPHSLSKSHSSLMKTMLTYEKFNVTYSELIGSERTHWPPVTDL